MQRDFATILEERIVARQTARAKKAQPARFDLPRLNFVRDLPEPRCHEAKAETPVPSCLELLGLTHASDVASVKRAFRRRALQLHPDRGGSHRGFIELLDAYQQALGLAA